MDKEQEVEKSEYTDKYSREKKEQFNAGGNDSDYDGGHPEDALSKEHKKDHQEHQSEDSYNAGGNASDYDGGHPEDVKPGSEGRISSEDKN